MWNKLKNIIVPNSNINWFESYTGPAFATVLNNEVVRVYFSGRGKDNVSRIGYCDINMKKDFEIINISKNPVLDIGEVGCFDENGVAYPWFIMVDEKVYLYYVGWVKGGKGGFINHLGLAIKSHNKEEFKRYSKVPVLERTDKEPIGTGSACVIKVNEKYLMWYTSFVRWEMQNNSFKHYYHIKYAESYDGINWIRNQIVALNFENPDEYCIAKPMVIYENNLYRMWYSYRGASYRIGYAESMDGINWIRKDNFAGIGVSPTGWDSEMIEYANIFKFDNMYYMLYNGNDFGKSGIGIAQYAEN